MTPAFTFLSFIIEGPRGGFEISTKGMFNNKILLTRHGGQDAGEWMEIESKLLLDALENLYIVNKNT